MVGANVAYLDHNATAPVRPEVIEAVTEALRVTGNPSSVHSAGRAARKLVEDARREVAVLVGAEPADVTFTSGGTEANALAARTCSPRRSSTRPCSAADGSRPIPSKRFR